MKVSLIIEGKTERQFLPYLRNYLQPRLSGRMPHFDVVPYNGRVPKEDKLKRLVNNLLNDRRSPSDHVIALTDVYTGTNPPDFSDATDAKSKMRAWVGMEPRFHPHAAQYEIEAWLLPYWPRIRQLAGHNQAAPGGNPEGVNHGNPPSRRIQQIFSRGSRSRYSKSRDFGSILRGQDLTVAVSRCPELKDLINSILNICGGDLIA